MARSKSSKRWLREHFDDAYVLKARADGWRSRAVYKLIELDERHALLRPGAVVVDLGAAPGGWSQVATRRVGASGCVVALDRLPMEPIAGVKFIQGDFLHQATLNELINTIGEWPVDIVISDMAPNISGVPSVDQPRSLLLAELALEMVDHMLRKGGSFIVKVFHGEGLDAYLREVRRRFVKVSMRKPRASRPHSREAYIVALGYKL